ncbi:hypothetical protein EVAR_46972_1 [Eumeta japonica]|uniref:Uncharacterized protein n=1 Tax=Eumeta variegata TaxID=151549 RepID=A0A4C1X583_EUMVA|nr:hypothetical protein EVAR_46972_1 [Eumeta japonica]
MTRVKSLILLAVCACAAASAEDEVLGRLKRDIPKVLNCDEDSTRDRGLCGFMEKLSRQIRASINPKACPPGYTQVKSECVPSTRVKRDNFTPRSGSYRIPKALRYEEDYVGGARSRRGVVSSAVCPPGQELRFGFCMKTLFRGIRDVAQQRCPDGSISSTSGTCNVSFPKRINY